MPILRMFSLFVIAFVFCSIGDFSYSQTFNLAQKPTIAVMNFSSITGDESIDAMLSVGTAETIISDLAKIPEIIIVEREKISKVIKEIELGLSGIVDEKTAQKAGLLLGAQYILVGNWQKFGSNYRVNARLIEVETAQVVIPFKETGTDKYIFEMQDKISEEIISKMDIDTDIKNIVKIRKKETESISAYKEFSRGLVEYDKGNKSVMKIHMERALEIDPLYEKPKKYIDITYDEYQAKLGIKKYSKAVWGSALLLTSGLAYGLSYSVKKDHTIAALVSGGTLAYLLITLKSNTSADYIATKNGTPIDKIFKNELDGRVKAYNYSNRFQELFPYKRWKNYTLMNDLNSFLPREQHAVRDKNDPEKFIFCVWYTLGPKKIGMVWYSLKEYNNIWKIELVKYKDM